MVIGIGGCTTWRTRKAGSVGSTVCCPGAITMTVFAHREALTESFSDRVTSDVVSYFELTKSNVSPAATQCRSRRCPATSKGVSRGCLIGKRATAGVFVGVLVGVRVRGIRRRAGRRVRWSIGRRVRWSIGHRACRSAGRRVRWSISVGVLVGVVVGCRLPVGVQSGTWVVVDRNVGTGLLVGSSAVREGSIGAVADTRGTAGGSPKARGKNRTAPKPRTAKPTAIASAILTGTDRLQWGASEACKRGGKASVSGCL